MIKKRALIDILDSRLVDSEQYLLTVLQKKSLREAMRWAANADGILQRVRLEWVAKARGYSDAWVEYNTGLLWTRAFEQMKGYAQRQTNQRRRRRERQRNREQR